MRTIDPFDIHHHQLQRILLSAVLPRPIAFASTIDKAGNPNLSPFSCFNTFGVNPSTLIFSPSRSSRNNELKDTFLNLKEVPEVVLNLVTYSMIEQVNLTSTEFPHGVNEFYKAGFTPVPSEKVRPFRVKESPVQMECKIRDIIETSKHAGAANLVICEVLLIHVSEKVLDRNGDVDIRRLDAVGRMGGDFYVRASGKALFSLSRPSYKSAIGVDSLPENVQMSRFLTGNDLGRLGTLNQAPTTHEILKYIDSEEFRNLCIEHAGNKIEIVDAAHALAHTKIENGLVIQALSLLLAAEQLLDDAEN